VAERVVMLEDTSAELSRRLQIKEVCIIMSILFFFCACNIKREKEREEEVAERVVMLEDTSAELSRRLALKEVTHPFPLFPLFSSAPNSYFCSCLFSLLLSISPQSNHATETQP
jgi:hypothetical protein